jgi:hypothetical protein
MPEILLSSKGVAAMIREDKNFEQTQLPHIFKTTKSRVTAQKSLLEASLQGLWEGGQREGKARL